MLQIIATKLKVKVVVYILFFNNITLNKVSHQTLGVLLNFRLKNSAV